MFVIEVLIGTCCEGGLWVVGGLCGKSCWACARASLIIFGAILNLFFNSWKDKVCWVSSF